MSLYAVTSDNVVEQFNYKTISEDLYTNRKYITKFPFAYTSIYHKRYIKIRLYTYIFFND